METNKAGMIQAANVLKKYFGYDDFREGQKELISAVLDGRDVLGIMPTGAGKSMCFQIPALMMEGITLVVSPLISLMKDQVSALNQAGIHAAFLNSSLTAGQYRKALSLAEQGRYKIIYIAPERLETESFLSFALHSGQRISLFAVDEAHCISQWGQDFRPSYLKILNFLKKLPYRPVVGAYTATATADVRADILDILELRDPLVTVTGFNRSNLFFSVEKPVDKYRALVSYLRNREREAAGSSGIVYCLTRKSVEEVSYHLRKDGFSVTRYHAGLSDEERRVNQEDFIFDRRQIMVATNAFGMGIDKSDVRFVIHYNMPKNMESYYQEAGRAGRDGEASECILYYEPMDVRTNRFLIEHGEDNEALGEMEAQMLRERDLERLKQMTFYCFTNSCLREYILRYFGERAPGYCGSCRNCLTQYEEADITEEAASIFACIGANRVAYGITVIIDILRGSKNQRIHSRGLDKNPEYGRLAHVTASRLRQIIQELLLREYLEQRGEEYPVLAVLNQPEELQTGEGRLVMKLAKEHETRQDSGKETKSRRKRTAAAVLSEQDEMLFERLRSLRSEIAAEERVPPYIVFSDRSLVQMSAGHPVTPEELLEIYGVGEFKVKKYGQRFLDAIRETQKSWN